MVCDTFALLCIINCNFHKSILPSFCPSIHPVQPGSSLLGPDLGVPRPGQASQGLAQASHGLTWASQVTAQASKSLARDFQCMALAYSGLAWASKGLAWASQGLSWFSQGLTWATHAWYNQGPRACLRSSQDLDTATLGVDQTSLGLTQAWGRRGPTDRRKNGRKDRSREGRHMEIHHWG